jgi:hypothetical protein
MVDDAVRARDPRLVAGLALGCLAACSAGAEVYPTDPGLRASPDGSADASGCLVVASAYAGTGCRADWSCGEGGLLELVCDVGDGGTTCACLVDEQIVSSTSLDGGSCADGAAPEIAAAACGWSVP